MKRFAWLILCVFCFTACKKYRLSQPAYLHFGWKFNQSDTCKAQFTGLEFYLKNFEIVGDRKEGEDILMTKDINSDLISFTGNGSLSVGMDVPVGEYENFTLTMNVPKKSPALVIKGTFNTGTEVIPMRIEWYDAKVLPFKANAQFELKKKKDYDVNMNLNVQRMLENVSANQWANPTYTNENGVTTFVINNYTNVSIFHDIDLSIYQAMYLSVP
jgi:hypothetical protein